MLKKITLFLIFITWPISLFLANTPNNFLKYVFPIFDSKLVLFPVLFVLIYFRWKKPLLVLTSLVLLILFIKPFFGQTILIPDYEAGQQVLQKQELYHSITLARIFQNKARIRLDKLTNNFFALIDPNNYFFGFAPRQITVDNQNLKKFPFLSLPFFLVGLYYLKKYKDHKIVVAVLLAGIINLTLLTNFDRSDFILWIPLFLIILNGINILDEKLKSKAKYVYAVFIFFSSIEIMRLFVK